MGTLIIVLIIAALIVLWAIVAYNGFVKLENRVEEAWSDIDVQLKRRHNLIPNLISTVKGYASHEKGVFEEVTQARTKALEAEGTQEKAKAESSLAQGLKSLFAVAENYPDLKASQNFLELQQELRDTEDKIQAARRFYNGNVRDFNTKMESFPSNIIASVFGFKQKDLFEIEEIKERDVPKVDFNQSS